MQYECEKLALEDDGDPPIKLLIFEVGADGLSTVLDITHHNTEELADAWLRENWGVSAPPKLACRLRFEHD